MYKTLEAKLVFVGMTKKELAKKMNIGYNTLLLKFKGESSFTFDEALIIKRIINADEPIEELFKKNA